MVANSRNPLRVVGDILFWLAPVAALVFFLFPLLSMLITSIKPRVELTLLPPSYTSYSPFQPVGDNYLAVFTKASELGTITQSTTQRQFELSAFPGALLNSVIIGGGTTVLAVVLGTLAAYAFSRFRVRGESDLLFFILSTRMLPPIVVLVPIFLMFTKPFGFLEGTAATISDPNFKSFVEGISQLSLRESYVGITPLHKSVGL